MQSVGFIGLGLMGKPMSKRLLKAGYSLTVYNRSRQPMEELRELGAGTASSPKEVAELSDVTITMLPDSQDVESVMLGKDGVIEGARSGSVVVDMSTISPFVTVMIYDRFREVGVQMLDAPVTGGTLGAEGGTLTIMVGGDRDAFERCLPIFLTLGKKVHYMGPSGSGQMTKLCNQVAVALSLLGACEALILASKAGLDLQKVLDVLSSGAASSWQLTNLGPRIIEGDLEPGFKAEHLQKDLRIVGEVSERLSVFMPGSSLAHELMKSLGAIGMGKKGTQSLILILEQLSSHRLREGSHEAL